MPAERFYINQPLENGLHVFLEKEELHHLAHVIRLKTGDTLELVNGMGSLAEGTLEVLERQKAVIYLTSCFTSPPPSYEIVLAQALPRQPRLEYILEKSVELGATKIWLFPGLLSEKKEFSPSQVERIRYILASALKQCGRLYLPELVLSPPLLSWQKSSLPYPSFFGDIRNEAPSFLSFLTPTPPSSLLIAIGPEKGFHVKEVEHMENLNMQGVHLHPNILRTDTAAIFSVSLASAFLT